MKSAVYGLLDMLLLANRCCGDLGWEMRFECHHLKPDELSIDDEATSTFHAVIMPPSYQQDYFLSPDVLLLAWLNTQHERGAVACSACAGAFILAAAGILNNHCVTTHWKLTETFAQYYPDIQLDSDKIVIDQGDVITAGGLMSWLDLGLEIVARFASPLVMHQLGQILVVDTGLREQRFYRRFSPRMDHGDIAILKVQHYLHRRYAEPLTIASLAAQGFLTERTFLRRFIRATGMKPTHYLQSLRVQKACEQMASSQQTFESIALDVGYSDDSSFRKVFIKVMGLTPSAFRQRFNRLED